MLCGRLASGGNRGRTFHFIYFDVFLSCRKMLSLPLLIEPPLQKIQD